MLCHRDRWYDRSFDTAAPDRVARLTRFFCFGVNTTADPRGPRVRPDFAAPAEDSPTSELIPFGSAGEHSLRYGHCITQLRHGQSDRMTPHRCVPPGAEHLKHILSAVAEQFNEERRHQASANLPLSSARPAQRLEYLARGESCAASPRRAPSPLLPHRGLNPASIRRGGRGQARGDPTIVGRARLVRADSQHVPWNAGRMRRATAHPLNADRALRPTSRPFDSPRP